MTTKHFKLPELVILISENIPVLLHGEKGTGKTTVLKQVAEELKLAFFALSMTRQTTLSHLLGFMNVNGIYVPSLFRNAVEYGGLFLLDELDAADPNVILAINTLENGFVSFPDAVINVHEDFRLVATANPFNDHSHYTGRATLDAATLDRFDKVSLERDSILEASLVSSETYEEMTRIRQVILNNNIDMSISMRDSLRWNKRKSLGLTGGYIKNVLLGNIEGLYEEFLTTQPKKVTKQEDIKTIDALWASIRGEN